MNVDGRGEILLILNPVAGKGRAVEMLESFLPVLEEGGSPVTVYQTKEAGDAIRVIRTEGMKFKRIIVAGGDGTLNELVNGVISANLHVDLGYLPIGTTCDFAATLNLPKDLVEAARLARYGTPKELEAEFHLCREFRGFYGCFLRYPGRAEEHNWPSGLLCESPQKPK